MPTDGDDEEWQKNLVAKKLSVACESRLAIFLPSDFFAITFLVNKSHGRNTD